MPALLLGCWLLLPRLGIAGGEVPPATFTDEQAERGARVYAQHCQSCHGRHLSDGAHAVPIKGDAFRINWARRPVADLLTYLSENMPPRLASTLSLESHTDVLAFILQQNGEQAGEHELSSDPRKLAGMLLPTWPNYASGGGLAPGVQIPPAPARPDPLETIRPVTDVMLEHPDDGDWLMWRRTYDAYGFSPLEQIDAANVSGLGLAWSWTLPQGPNASPPVVHDGVMFVHGFGDKLQALDAATGELLWQYSRRLPAEVTVSHKRSIAIHGDRVFLPTSDAHVVALDVRTGDVVWDTDIGNSQSAEKIDTGPLEADSVEAEPGDEPPLGTGVGLVGGPIVARGKVMIGTSGFVPGGNYIVGLDATTGREDWRFHVIQRPFESGRDTWNGIPLEARNGGSLWIPGSYDPERNLAYFGPGNTYDTKLLRYPSEKPGVTNDGLYLASTLALDPETGRLVWQFQHASNDQWDLDWAFERQSMRLLVGGKLQDVVVTAGKTMIFDILQPDNGKYLASVDLGLQNLVTSIDPRTGAKRVDPGLLPGDGKTKMICPHVSGGRGWLPTAYDPAGKTLVVPITEACMDLVPGAEGESTVLTTGVRWTVRPRPGSDGKYGRLQAIDLGSRETVWTVRERAPFTSGTLATAGGLVFAGSLDRTFKAYDTGTGDKLWSVRLNDAPTSPPITYSAGGVQYVAVIVGPGGYQSLSYSSLVPEIRNPADSGTMLWVFALPDERARTDRDSD